MDRLVETFRARRIALEMTQQQVAKAAGLGTKTVVAFEAHHGGISLSNLRRLLAVVRLDLTTREASTRPTLDELSEIYASEQTAPVRTRASRRKKAKR